ncbi:hypothetical protein E5288_WYG001315 [Bos mutus]|uniref:Uncharacterized protein n=1 Tax=Bos mutus TaxID=72004 RepID=A0A6B0RBT3_9CETA|nr:hypothetical protein [Bos mutus]
MPFSTEFLYPCDNGVMKTEAKGFFQTQVSLDMLTMEESYSFPATELLAVGSLIHQEMQEGEENRTQHSPARAASASQVGVMNDAQGKQFSSAHCLEQEMNQYTTQDTYPQGAEGDLKCINSCKQLNHVPPHLVIYESTEQTDKKKYRNFSNHMWKENIRIPKCQKLTATADSKRPGQAPGASSNGRCIQGVSSLGTPENPLNCHMSKPFTRDRGWEMGFSSCTCRCRDVRIQDIWMTSSSKYPYSALQFLSLSQPLEAAHLETAHQSTSRLTRMTSSFLQIPPTAFIGLLLFLLLEGAEEFWLLTTGPYLPINYSSIMLHS